MVVTPKWGEERDRHARQEDPQGVSGLRPPVSSTLELLGIVKLGLAVAALSPNHRDSASEEFIVSGFR